jgi:DNA-binding MarR family transcriptional regulator/GNAT superfamily N-acetyltransferase
MESATHPTPIDVSGVERHQVQALRAFNRFYTQHTGLLAPYLESHFSLTEVRVLYELAHHAPCTATDLSQRLQLDAGYLSRLLRRFHTQGWTSRTRMKSDARQVALALTSEGRTVFEPLQQRSREAAALLLATLPPNHRAELISALGKVQSLLAPASAENAAPTFVLRDVRPGDMGWVVQQHGELYAREYGWDVTFEALVADIVAGMIRQHDPLWERGWIAERDGERVGSVFVVRKSEEEAQLRLLLLTPAARGLGLGARLTEECLTFARAKGYRRIVLWTNSCLETARSIYARRGFELERSEPYRGYGQDLVGEHWALTL